MTNVDRLALAKKLLCNEIMAATSAFDLAKSLWYVCLADPEWLRNEYDDDELRKAVYQSL